MVVYCNGVFVGAINCFARSPHLRNSLMRMPLESIKSCARIDHDLEAMTRLSAINQQQNRESQNSHTFSINVCFGDKYAIDKNSNNACSLPVRRPLVAVVVVVVVVGSSVGVFDASESICMWVWVDGTHRRRPLMAPNTLPSARTDWLPVTVSTCCRRSRNEDGRTFAAVSCVVRTTERLLLADVEDE